MREKIEPTVFREQPVPTATISETKRLIREWSKNKNWIFGNTQTVPYSDTNNTYIGPHSDPKPRSGAD